MLYNVEDAKDLMGGHLWDSLRLVLHTMESGLRIG